MKTKTFIFGLVFLFFATSAVGHTNTKSVILRIGIWDLTEDNPIHTRAEIWIRGVGSKYLIRKVGLKYFTSLPFLVGKFPIEVKQKCFFYPESRKGKR